jgi:uncharacterized glyoxalase superfamily protein PhnB
MPRKLTPLHYVLVTIEGNGEEAIEYYAGSHSARAIKARLRKERRGGNRDAQMYRLLHVNCSPDGVDVWGTYENVENSEDVQNFSWS